MMTPENNRRLLIQWILLIPLILVFSVLASPSSFAQLGGPAQPDERPSPYGLKRDPERPRSDFLMPLTGLLFPGFDQWWEGQYTYAAVYSGIWLGGNFYSATVAAQNDLDGQIARRRQASRNAEKNEDDYAIDGRDVTVRKYLLGQLIGQGAGGFSAWHSFRSAVRSRQAHGQYAFLEHEETPLEVLLAPLNFRHLTKPTTFIPLAVAGVLGAIVLTSETPEDYERTAFTSSDGFFAATYSWNAGTHEEAFFRGYLMPLIAEYSGNDFLANLSQSCLFALAHFNTNPKPLPQLFLGFHLGSVSQRRNWTLSESVFIHTWWDVIAFGVAYHYKKVAPEGMAEAVKPVLWLPPLSLAF